MGGAKHSFSTSESMLPGWIQPYATEFLQNYAGATMPGGNVMQMPGNLNQQVAGFTPFQLQGLQGIGNVANSPGMGALTGADMGLASDTMLGKYLDPSTNPFLKSTYDAAARDMTDQYATGVAPSMDVSALRAGAMGSSGYGQAQAQSRYGLGQNLANLANDVYGGNYQQERSRQLYEQQLAPSVISAQYDPSQELLQAGGQQQQQQQTQFDTNFQNALRQVQFPLTMLDAFGGALGAARGPAMTADQRSPIRTGALGFK